MRPAGAVTVLLLVAVSMPPGGGGARGVARAAGLSMLAPRPGGDANRMKEPPRGGQDERSGDSLFYKKRPTGEAAIRLEALEKQHHERSSFQLETPAEFRSYQESKRELARWYVKALLRAHFSEWLRDSKRFVREERIRGELRERARRPAGGKPSAAGEPGGSDVAPVVVASVPGAAPAFLPELLMRVSGFVERLTNEGVFVTAGAFAGKLNLDIQSAVFRMSAGSHSLALGRFELGQLDVGMSYRLRPTEQPLPFSGGNADSGNERLVLWGTHSLPGLGASGSVRYQYLRQSLVCGAAKQLAGPLAASVERAWTFQGAVATNTVGSLSVSVVF